MWKYNALTKEPEKDLREQGGNRDYVPAMEDMRNQALKEGMINIAKKMLEDGTITLEKIAEFVGLSVDEVRKLKADQNM